MVSIYYIYKQTTNYLKKIKCKGIGANVYYPIPVHKIPFYKLKTKLPVTDWASKHVFSLPIHPKVTKKNLKLYGKNYQKILNECIRRMQLRICKIITTYS